MKTTRTARRLILLSLVASLLATCGKDNPTSPNVAPSLPAYPSPVDSAGDLGLSLTLDWACTDPENDPITFDIYLGRDRHLTKIASKLPVDSLVVDSLAYGATYQWRVIVRDNHHNFTLGPLWMFTTVANVPPSVPSVPLPFDNAIDRPIVVMLSWHVSDPEADALTYDLYFGTDPNPPLLVTNLPQNSYRPVTLQYGTIFYWRVLAKDSEQNETSGPVWSFQTVPNRPPATPSSPSPPNGAQHMPVNISLGWQSSDAEGDPLRYDVYLGTDTDPPLVASDITVNSYTPENLETSKTYNWKIVAKDDQSNESAGPEWSFSTLSGVWRAMNSGTTVSLTGVWGTAANVYAVGENGTILKYDGSSWTPMTSGTTNHIRAVWGTSDNNIYVVGWNGMIRHFDGSTWTPMPSGTTSELLDIWGIAADHILAVGQDGTIIRYNGISFTPMTSPTSLVLNSVWGNSRVDAMAVGGTGTTLAYIRTGWFQIPSPTTYYLYGVWGIGNEIYAVGFRGKVLLGDGFSWNTMPAVTSKTLRGVWGSSPIDVFVVGYDGLIMHFNSIAWQTMSSPTVFALYDIWGRGEKDVYAVGFEGTILHYSP